MSKPVSICVIGSGYVGLVAAVCFAEIGHRVVCVDNDEARVKTLREGGVPIFERRLPELLAKHLNRGVEFTSDLARAVQQSEAIFIAVGTPQGDTGAADLSYVEAVVAEIVYTNDWIRRVLHRHGVDPQNFDVVSNPEFLREGTAIGDFLHPDRIVVGAGTERSADVLKRIYEPLTAGTYYASPGALPGTCSAQCPARLLVTSAQSAEIVKHASNAFLALKISFINAVANLAEAVDADIEDIATGMGMDSRIGPGFLRAGLGYGGSCFPKDVAAFGPCAASAWRSSAWPSREIPTIFASLPPSVSSKNYWKQAQSLRPTTRRPWSAPKLSCRPLRSSAMLPAFTRRPKTPMPC